MACTQLSGFALCRNEVAPAASREMSALTADAGHIERNRIQPVKIVEQPRRPDLRRSVRVEPLQPRASTLEAAMSAIVPQYNPGTGHASARADRSLECGRPILRGSRSYDATFHAYRARRAAGGCRSRRRSGQQPAPASGQPARVGTFTRIQLQGPGRLCRRGRARHRQQRAASFAI